MGSVFSFFIALGSVDNQENAEHSSGSRNGCCACFHIMTHALHEALSRSNEGSVTSSLADSSVNDECGAEFVSCTSEDEDECPICLEEYTLENPKINTECLHGYHLGCLYEWEKRSKNCPVCGNVMVFTEII